MDSIALVEISEPQHAVSFLINGRDLAEIIGDDSSPDAWLTANTIIAHREDTIFADQPKSPHDRLVVLVCTCGEIPCSNTTVRVIRTEQSVIWSDFAKGWREDFVKYRKIGPFQFEPEQYARVLGLGRQIAESSK